MRYVCSVSFGKDSLAMLLRLLDENRPLDEVVFYDTGMEFACIYKIRDKVKLLLEEKGIKFTELHPDNPFLYDMFEREVKGKDGTIHYGYSWCGGRCRWGTSRKLKTLNNYTKGCYIYVGIAVDEKERLARENQQNPYKIYPLVEWGMTERDCLEYARQKGWNWIENDKDLYDYLDRVSCWCCANKNIKECRNIYHEFKEYWDKLKKLQDKTDRPFHNGYTIYELEERYKKEDFKEEKTNEKRTRICK